MSEHMAESDQTVTEVVWGVRFPDRKGGGEYEQSSEEFARRRVHEFPWLELLRCERTTVVRRTPWETVDVSTPPEVGDAQ